MYDIIFFAMIFKLVLPLLIYASPVWQSAFPHSTGKAGMKIERLSKVNLSAQEKKAIATLVLGASPEAACIKPGNTLKEEIGDIRMVRTELAAGEQDFLVQASDNCSCGGTGNCAFWILRKGPKRLKTLLAIEMVQTFSIEPTSSNGLKDVSVADSGATSSDLILYQFNGQRYRKTKCARSVYSKAGKARVFSVPCTK
jgi:hypothetical protein